MRASAILAIVLAGVAFDAQQRTLPGASVRLTGRVVAADTGAPLRGATVTVRAGSRLWAESSGDDGRFEILDLPALALTVNVAKSGFLSSDVTMTLSPKDGAVIDRGDVPLVRAAAIAGRVLDAFGDPVSDAVVQAHYVFYPAPGERLVGRTRQAITNDLGEYRVYGLAPGVYYVAAGEPQPAIARTSSEAGRAPTFYPGTTIATDALPVRLRGGDQMLGTDIRLLPVPLRRVVGRVIDSRGQPSPNGRAMLNLLSSDGGGLVLNSSSPVDSRGDFSFAGVPPGEYRIDALGAEILPAVARTGAVPASVDAPVREGGGVVVTVPAEGPIGDVVIQLTPGRELRGRLLIDGVVPSSPAGVRVVASPAGREAITHAGLRTAAAQVQPDGSFVLRGLAGTVILGATGLPSGAALLRVVAPGLDITDDGIDMDRGHVAGVEVLITTTPTTVKGMVTTVAGAPAAATVIVMAEDPRLRITLKSRHVVVASASREGGFRLSGLPAGRYLAVAVENHDRQTWADPVNLERLARGATPFTLTEGGAVTLALTRQIGASF